MKVYHAETQAMLFENEHLTTRVVSPLAKDPGLLIITGEGVRQFLDMLVKDGINMFHIDDGEQVFKGCCLQGWQRTPLHVSYLDTSASPFQLTP